MYISQGCVEILSSNRTENEPQKTFNERTERTELVDFWNELNRKRTVIPRYPAGQKYTRVSAGYKPNELEIFQRTRQKFQTNGILVVRLHL